MKHPKPSCIASFLLLTSVPAFAQPPVVTGGKLNPKLRVDPNVLTFPVEQRLANMEAAMKEMRDENKALKKRLAEVEAQSAQATKDLVAVKLLLPGADKALSSINQDLADFKAEYKTHQHGSTMGLLSFHDLMTVKSLQQDRLIPYYAIKTDPNKPGDRATPVHQMAKTDWFQRTTQPVQSRNGKEVHP